MGSPPQRDRSRGPSSQRIVVREASSRRFRIQVSHGEPPTPQNLGNDAMSRALQHIFCSPFFEEIESIDLPRDLSNLSL